MKGVPPNPCEGEPQGEWGARRRSRRLIILITGKGAARPGRRHGVSATNSRPAAGLPAQGATREPSAPGSSRPPSAGSTPRPLWTETDVPLTLLGSQTTPKPGRALPAPGSLSTPTSQPRATCASTKRKVGVGACSGPRLREGPRARPARPGPARTRCTRPGARSLPSTCASRSAPPSPTSRALYRNFRNTKSLGESLPRT